MKREEWMIEAFKEYFEHLLTKYHLSQRELAKRSNVNYVTINRYFTQPSDQRIDYDTIEKFAKGLGCSKGERYGMHRLGGSVDYAPLSALSQVLKHWREFGPECGFDELIETTVAPFIDE